MIRDQFGRVNTYLRVSVTDRCNLRCVYCIPEMNPKWMPKAEILTFDEMEQIGKIGYELGMRKFRFTGGEPTLRRDIDKLVARFNALGPDVLLAMTTNGVIFAKQAQALYDAGLRRVNISVDSLDGDRFREITQTGDLANVWAGIEAAVKVGFPGIKLNIVVGDFTTDVEITDFAKLARETRYEIRLIENMPDKDWHPGVVYRRENPGQTRFEQIRQRMIADYGLELIPRDPMQGPSELYRFADGKGLGKIGFISPVARPFCEECNRLRLTAVGFLRSCLLEEDGVDLRGIIRDATLTSSEISSRLREAFQVAAELKPQFHKARRPRSFSQIGG